MSSPIENGTEAESLTAITGVVQPVAYEQLRELSGLLGCDGVEVVGVERYEGSTARSWFLTVMEEHDGARRERQLPVLRTYDFHSADHLNFLAWRLGRDQKLPRLSRMDGRRALRLMHEIAEATGRVTGDDIAKSRGRLDDVRRVDDLLTLGIRQYEAYREDNGA